MADWNEWSLLLAAKLTRIQTRVEYRYIVVHFIHGINSVIAVDDGDNVLLLFGSIIGIGKLIRQSQRRPMATYIVKDKRLRRSGDGC